MNRDYAQTAVHSLIDSLDIPLSEFDEALLGTPLRVAKAFEQFTSGYSKDSQEVLKTAFQSGNYDQMIVVDNIEFFSLCEHHLLPFYGRVHIGYIPNGRVFGLSKLARVVDIFARRLQIQERLTQQISDSVYTALLNTVPPGAGEKDRIGVGVVVEAKHFCMIARGVQKQNTTAVTSALKGNFLNEKVRMEFLQLINSRGRFQDV